MYKALLHCFEPYALEVEVAASRVKEGVRLSARNESAELLRPTRRRQHHSTHYLEAAVSEAFAAV